jgi:hypothetical protein
VLGNGGSFAAAATLDGREYVKKVLLGAAAAALVMCALVGGALADNGKTDAQVVGTVRIDPADASVGYVTAR